MLPAFFVCLFSRSFHANALLRAVKQRKGARTQGVVCVSARGAFGELVWYFLATTLRRGGLFYWECLHLGEELCLMFHSDYRGSLP